MNDWGAYKIMTIENLQEPEIKVSPKKGFIFDYNEELVSLWAEHVRTTESTVLSKGESGGILEWNKNTMTSHYIFRIAAAGDRNNDKITTCNICRQNGFPREAIEFQKVNGRIRSDGTNEVKQWIVRNYFDGNTHEHKERRA